MASPAPVSPPNSCDSDSVGDPEGETAARRRPEHSQSGSNYYSERRNIVRASKRQQVHRATAETDNVSRTPFWRSPATRAAAGPRRGGDNEDARRTKTKGQVPAAADTARNSKSDGARGNRRI
ncbi:hypothetical protein V5799_014579 [Amblyomma americanum]|uniref:Uncharacterized protein n=1 Tax=Amblyomma americanum TaxID=6943 RepID=A0AAQ4E2L6_AMBAM